MNNAQLTYLDSYKGLCSASPCVEHLFALRKLFNSFALYGDTFLLVPHTEKILCSLVPILVAKCVAFARLPPEPRISAQKVSIKHKTKKRIRKISLFSSFFHAYRTDKWLYFRWQQSYCLLLCRHQKRN